MLEHDVRICEHQHFVYGFQVIDCLPSMDGSRALGFDVL
jgi:hypothetical protein